MIAALDEANELIRSDSRAAAEILFAAEATAGFAVDELVEVLRDPDIKFTTTPENTQKYADVHARDRLDRESPCIVARSVLPRDPWQPGQLSRRRAPHPRRCSA